MMLAQAMLSEDPTILNSNLLPVNAKGDVLLRSVLSLRMPGSTSEPIFIISLLRRS